MSGDIAAAGDVITGALTARAVEPHGGAGHDAAGGLCLNCGTRLIGGYCHACGQSGHVHRTVGAIGHEIAHGVFHFEGKVWRTLPMLVLHPGALTRRYVAGERVRFVSPLALFLFTVFLMFATISWVGGEVSDQVTGVDTSAIEQQLHGQLAEARGQLQRTQQRRDAAVAAHQPVDELDSQLKARSAAVASLQAVAAATPGSRSTRNPFRTGWSRLDHGIAKATNNPGLAIYKLQTSAYKYSWLLIPLSTPFVALLFLWRRRFGLYDHAIFVTYSITFMMLLAVTLMLAGVANLPDELIAPAALLIPPAHMFAQLRGAYSLSRRSAAWRTVALLVFATVALGTFVTLLLLHGLTE